jgi:hypothetical protein
MDMNGTVCNETCREKETSHMSQQMTGDRVIQLLKARVHELERVIRDALRTSISQETWNALYVPKMEHEELAWISAPRNYRGEPYPGTLEFYALQNTENFESLERKVKELEDALEIERNRVVYCGMVALANTRESAAKLRAETCAEYKTASSGDVERLVDKFLDLCSEVEGECKG